VSVLERGPVTIFVAGRPRTKGSLTPQVSRGKGGATRVHLVETGEHSVAWKRTMIRGIWEQCGITPLRRGAKIAGFDPEPYAGAVYVDGLFLFERERSVAVKRDGEVWESHDTPFPTAGDIGDEDKLRRNLLDALTQSGLIKDDRFVIGPSAAGMNGKRWTDWASKGSLPGVHISVYAA
jgi:hypothetical protein